MTPTRAWVKGKQVGTFLLERTFPGVGLVRRASGTDSVRMWGSLNDMLSTLWSHGRLDVLERIRNGALHPMKAFSMLQTSGIESFPRGAALETLDQMTEWAKTFKASKRHADNVRSALGLLVRSAIADEHLSDLPAILRRYKQGAGKSQFRNTKMAVLAFLRQTRGRDELYMQCADVPASYIPPGGNPFTPAQLAAFGLKQPYLGMAWTMCLTGMGQADYWGNWEIQIDRVKIPGAKGRPRIVPKVGTLVPPGATYKDMLEAFEATGHRLYDCRNSYSAWLEDAGVAPSRIALYMGHKAKNQTQHYQRRKVEPYLRADAKLLSAYIGTAQRAARQA